MKTKERALKALHKIHVAKDRLLAMAMIIEAERRLALEEAANVIPQTSLVYGAEVSRLIRALGEKDD